MKTVAFLGAKKIGFDCLSHLIDHAAALGIRVAGVLGAPNHRFPEIDMVALAERNGIAAWTDLDQMVESAPFDFLISVQFNSILRQHHIDQARIMAINLHMAPLPEYRGCNQFSFAIIEGKKEFGTTLHRLEAGIDSGAILAEKRFAIPEDADVAGLVRMTEEASLALFKQAMPDILNGKCTPVEQSQLVAQRGTSLHFRKEIDALKNIDPAWPAEKIKRHIRATSMPGFEPPYQMVNGQKQHLRLADDGSVETFEYLP